MHPVVIQNLEEYLSGALEPVAQRELEAHLNGCAACRGEVRSMQEVSALFGALQSDEPVAPPAGFYARVMQQVDQGRATPSFASLLGLDFAFGRRLVFSSLLFLAVLGSYLITRETAYPSGPSPEAVMAQQESPAFQSAPAEDNMLVTLTAYEH